MAVDYSGIMAWQYLLNEEMAKELAKKDQAEKKHGKNN